MGVKVEEDRVV